MHLDPSPRRARTGRSHICRKIEAAVALQGVVRLVLEDGQVEVVPRTWYKERGVGWLAGRRRDSGAHFAVEVDRIQDVRAY